MTPTQQPVLSLSHRDEVDEATTLRKRMVSNKKMMTKISLEQKKRSHAVSVDRLSILVRLLVLAIRNLKKVRSPKNAEYPTDQM
jgi:hypothetical protein